MNIVYFKHRLQGSEFATNIAGILMMTLGFELSPEPGVFYGRTYKAIVMALTPCLCFVLMRLRFEYSKWVSLWCALAVGLVPGLFVHYGMAFEIGFEVIFGLAALILAGSSRLWVVGVSGALLMFSALCYGPGASFGPAVAWYVFRHPDWKRRFVVSALSGLAVVAIAVWYWTNIQSLFFGGGLGGKATPWEAFLLIRNDLIRGGGSYYYPLEGHPALGLHPMPWIAFLGIASALYRWKRLLPLAMLAISSILLACSSGTLPGVRRATVFVMAATILGVCFLDYALERFPRIKVAAAGVTLLALLFDLHVVTQGWQSGRLFVQKDFELAGDKERIEDRLADYRKRLVPVPEASKLVSPRSTYAMLHLVTLPDPIVSFETFLNVNDKDDPPFPPGATRFSVLIEKWKRRGEATSSSGR